MGIELIARPGKVVPSWDEFISTHPPGIALDGYIAAGPDYDPSGPHQNFDHHHGVKREYTLSTAQQVGRAIVSGITRTAGFQRDGEFHPNVYVNDSDQDVSLAVYLLDNAQEIAHMPEDSNKRMRLRNLVEVGGALDALGGMSRYNPTSSIMEHAAYIFDPYTEMRNSGELYLRDGREQERHLRVIEQIAGRIALYVDGQGERRELETDYSIIGGGPGWSMFTEDGKEGRMGALWDNIESFVIARQRPDGNYTYTVAKASQYVPFNVPERIARLQIKESARAAARGLSLPPDEVWGGSNLIGGSPRLHGSLLVPEEVTACINE